jgi:hypothetical protein
MPIGCEHVAARREEARIKLLPRAGKLAQQRLGDVRSG